MELNKKIAIGLFIICFICISYFVYVIATAPTEQQYLVNGEKCKIINWNNQYIQVVCGEMQQNRYIYEIKQDYGELVNIFNSNDTVYYD